MRMARFKIEEEDNGMFAVWPDNIEITKDSNGIYVRTERSVHYINMTFEEAVSEIENAKEYPGFQFTYNAPAIPELDER